MAETMQCLRIEEWGGPLEIAETPVPEPRINDVVVGVEATGVGQTVANALQGNMGRDPETPRIPGHELVGTVTEVGEGVTHLTPGDRVTAYFHLTCGYCRHCHAGYGSICENHAGWVGVDIDGGYAEYARLPARNAIPVPSSIDPIAATTIPDAIGTPYHVAEQRAAINPGDAVMVFGAGGGVGIHMLQVAQYFGASVTAVDIADEKLDACADLGAAHTINTNDRSLTDAVEEIDVRYDAIIDFTGDTALLESAVGLLGPRGRLVNLTTFDNNAMNVSPREQVTAERYVLGSRYCSKHDLRRAGDLLADDIVKPVVSEVVGLDGVPELLETIEENRLLGRGAMTPT